MVQHLTHTLDLPHMELMRLKQEVVIKGKAGGHARCPYNIEQPILVQKKNLIKNSEYGITLHIGVPSHMSKVFY